MKILIYFISLITVSITAQSQSFEIPPKLNKGDTWTFQRTNFKTQEKSEPFKITVEKINLSDSVKTYIISNINITNRTWFFLNKDLNVSIVTANSVQNSNYYAWPMVVGNSIKTDRRTDTTSIQGACEVSGFEKIKVTAGDFEVAKIACKFYARNFFNDEGQVVLEEDYYFSPLVKRPVKIEIKRRDGKKATWGLHDVVELISYELK